MNRLPPLPIVMLPGLEEARRSAALTVADRLLDRLSFDNIPDLKFPERSLGFEIEATHDSCMDHVTMMTILSRMMLRLGLPFSIGKDETYQKWALTTDDTIRSPSDFRGMENPLGGVEVISPILRTAEDKKNYLKVLHAMRHLGFYAGQDCGSHVWFGLPEFVDLTQAGDTCATSDYVESVALCGPALKEALGPYLRESRHHSAYSGLRNAGPNWKWINLGAGQAMGENGKEAMLNMKHLVLRGALEFRSMGNTMDPVEIHKGLQVLEYALLSVKNSKRNFSTTTEFLIRNMEGTRGPLPLHTTRALLLKAKWSDTSISVAIHEGGRPVFMSGSDFLNSIEALELGVRQYAPVSAHSLKAYARTIFDSHVMQDERPKEVVDATRIFDDADLNTITNAANSIAGQDSDISRLAEKWLEKIKKTTEPMGHSI